MRRPLYLLTTAIALGLAQPSAAQRVDMRRDGNIITLKSVGKMAWQQGKKMEGKTKFKAAEAALDAGYSHFLVLNYDPKKTVKTHLQPGMGAVVGLPRLGARQVQTNSWRDAEMDVQIELVDGSRLAQLQTANDANLKNALTEYNTLGPEHGKDFQRRTEPGRKTLPPPTSNAKGKHW